MKTISPSSDRFRRLPNSTGILPSILPNLDPASIQGWKSPAQSDDLGERQSVGGLGSLAWSITEFVLVADKLISAGRSAQAQIDLRPSASPDMPSPAVADPSPAGLPMISGLRPQLVTQALSSPFPQSTSVGGGFELSKDGRGAEHNKASGRPDDVRAEA